MRQVLTVILGGGQGTRLWPLTRDRAKPAVPLGGKFRLIDVPISNSLHAGLNHIYVLTQFNSASLHRHIAQAYRFDSFNDGFVNILAAEQNVTNRDWYQGTADAVRRNLSRFTQPGIRETLILSGDQLYFMKLDEMVRSHREQDAELTIAVKPMPRALAPELGIMRMNGEGRIVEFVEKPSDPEIIDRFTLSADDCRRLGVDAESQLVLASMGIYVFRTELMVDLLADTSRIDFGRQVIPAAIADNRVHGFAHQGYWRDIGTISAFHEASLELTVLEPELNLYDPDYPLYTHPRFLPGSKVNRCDMAHAILAEGSIISDSTITSSIVGVRGVVREGCRLDQTILMGATHYESQPASGVPGLGVGRGCEVRRAIIDLDARIGDGCSLLNRAGVEEADGNDYFIRGGVIVVPRQATLAPGTEI